MFVCLCVGLLVCAWLCACSCCVFVCLVSVCLFGSMFVVCLCMFICVCGWLFVFVVSELVG